MSRLRSVALALEVYEQASDDEKWIAYAILRAVTAKIWGDA